MFNQITQYIDLAQLTLYAFWLFFAGLIYWLRTEDRREGYPLESDTPKRVGSEKNVLFPKPKLFHRPDGSTYSAPDFKRDEREISAKRTSPTKGAPLEPVGDPLLSNVGPAAYAERVDEPELTREGHHAIVPLRTAGEYKVNAGPDPRGWDIVGTDGVVAGKVTDIWIDRAEMTVRYLEVTLAASGEDGEKSAIRLVPLNSVLVRRDRGRVETSSIYANQFAGIPVVRKEHEITVLEEERISAYFAGGLLYADAKRAEPFV